jgi:hypothetical protein
MGGLRFLVVGALLCGFLRLRGVPVPSAHEWRGSAVVIAMTPILSAFLAQETSYP